MSAGKGDTPRPVDGNRYRANYDEIYRKSGNGKAETGKVKKP